MLRAVLIATLGLTALAATNTPMRFEQHKVLRVYADKAMAEKLDKMNLDIWREPTLPHGMDVRVEPERLEEVTALLRNTGTRFETYVDDVQRLIDLENVLPANFTSRNDSWYSQYHTYEETIAWLQTLPRQYPNLASLVTIGKTYEGRDLVVLKISRGSPKAAFWFDALLHAREWITGGVVNYIAGSLLDQYGKSEDTTRLIDNIDFYILPVFNADGYEFTRSNRMWRKTRTPNRGSSCIGTDPNRNWLYQWGGCGTSSDPCSDSYSGASPFSEPCLISVSDFLYDAQRKTNGLFKAYINFHAYSQLWMTPWGWTTSLPSDYSYINGVAAKAVAALKAVHGTAFDHGSISNIIYCASGSSADWTYGNLSITLSYGVELRDKGQYGFLLPATQIIPSGEETLAAVKVVAEEVLAKQL
eukprot:TRINITY_DN2158_c0_g4_i1.p1 TRINITY_DN2158_c0_g4~~TRINITY_DN2158_c0_g4_i1.p1  ORF type:complete len:416 (+),score=120.95 TRINITY_DN2158_c0_g4_i1:94-1341(+)